MKKSNIRFIVLLVFICQLAVFIHPAYATSNPIPGIDIIVKKKPSHITTRGNTGDKGSVLINLAEGDYDLLLLNVKKDSVKVNLTLTVAGQEPRNLSFTAKGDDIKKEMPFAMPGNGSITVSIFDRWGNLVTEKPKDPKETKDKPTPTDTKPIAEQNNGIEHNAGVTRGGTIAKPNSSNTPGNSAKSAAMQEVSTTRSMATGGSTNNIDTTPGNYSLNRDVDSKGRPSSANNRDVDAKGRPSSIADSKGSNQPANEVESRDRSDVTPGSYSLHRDVDAKGRPSSSSIADTKPGSQNRDVDSKGRPSSIANTKPANAASPPNIVQYSEVLEVNNTDSKPGQSNKKDGEEAGDKNTNPTGGAGPQKASIGTTRSNIKHVADEQSPTNGTGASTEDKNTNPTAAMQEVSTTRSMATGSSTNNTEATSLDPPRNPTHDVPPNAQVFHVPGETSGTIVPTDTKPCTTCSTDTRPWDDKRAEKGAFGIGAGINLIPFQTDISFSGMVSKRVELGTTLGGGYNKTNKSSTDCCRSFQGGPNDTVTLPGTSETKMLVTTATVGVTPFFKYHIDTKSNADVYIGVSAPVSLTTTSKTESIVTDLANNYERKTTTTNTGPLKINAGGGLIIGCRYFVYCGLALGIETNLGVTSTMQNGNNMTRISILNSGTNNNGAASVEDMGNQPVKTQDIGFGALHNVGVTLTWYLGRKPKPKPTPTPTGGSGDAGGHTADSRNIVAPRNPATGSNYTDPNKTDMPILKTPTSPNTEVASMTIKGSGESTPAGTPIVKSRTVSGNIKMEKGISNAGVSVVIEQSESGDKASAITDQQGNFSMVLGNDTVHIVYVNKQEYGKLKIVSPRDTQSGLPTGK